MVKFGVLNSDLELLIGTPLFDASFLSSLDKLNILARKIFRGKLRGEKRSRKIGQSVEFHDFRQYLPGDDIRRIDWNLYARLEKYFIKLFVEEEDVTIYLLIDCSKSMSHGHPNKFNYARRFAAALSYIALSNKERVQVAVFDSELNRIERPLRGKSRYKRLFDVISGIKLGGTTSLVKAISQFTAQKTVPGIVVILSDFLFPNPTQALSGLVGRGNQVTLIQVLSPNEIKPNLAGDLELVDAETGKSIEVSMGAGVMRKYQKNLDILKTDLKNWAMKTSSDYVFLSTDEDLSNVLFKKIRHSVLM